MLKKRKVKEEGGQNLFVEQNHRPQLLYTENDRHILDAAWEDASFSLGTYAQNTTLPGLNKRISR